MEREISAAHFLSFSGPPVINNINSPSLEALAGANFTLYCSYTANPTVALYKWQINSVLDLQQTLTLVYPTPDLSPHYYLSQHQLVMFHVDTSDAGLYTCNVTNFCGSATSLQFLYVLGELIVCMLSLHM